MRDIDSRNYRRRSERSTIRPTSPLFIAISQVLISVGNYEVFSGKVRY